MFCDSHQNSNNVSVDIGDKIYFRKDSMGRVKVPKKVNQNENKILVRAMRLPNLSMHTMYGRLQMEAHIEMLFCQKKAPPQIMAIFNVSLELQLLPNQRHKLVFASLAARRLESFLRTAMR